MSEQSRKNPDGFDLRPTLPPCSRLMVGSWESCICMSEQSKKFLDVLDRQSTLPPFNRSVGSCSLGRLIG